MCSIVFCLLFFNILFRMWQVGLINEEKLEINKLQKENSIEEDIKILERKK